MTNTVILDAPVKRRGPNHPDQSPEAKEARRFAWTQTPKAKAARKAALAKLGPLTEEQRTRKRETDLTRRDKARGDKPKRKYTAPFTDQSPEAREARRLAYTQTSEFKARARAGSQTPERRAAAYAGRQTLEYKAKEKAKRQTPEYKVAARPATYYTPRTPNTQTAQMNFKPA
jgi:hypothetical protein